ncbi:MAG: LysM peptidoglycan-binding domain-containing protein [Lentisphaeria bacterium]|nr:LysM peptidoglycan-binding domain-containing protein [Lentisphaeria bacterium]
MMIRKITLFLAAAAAAGCVYAQQGGPQPGRAPFRTTQEAVRYYENLVGRLAQQVRSMQDENAMLTASNDELKQRVARLESEMRALASDMAALRKQIAADAEVRKTQLNQLADRLAAPPPKPGKEPPAPHPVPVPPPDEPEMVWHVVERGTTLNALAKAYGVPVSEIMRVNKMKKPVIYAGQKLMIPQPKKKR